MSASSRMDAPVAELGARFGECVAAYCAWGTCSGPSWYFHQKTIERRRGHQRMSTLVEDEAFFEYLYATLTAWGLHRMGPGNTRLLDLAELRESVARQAAVLDDLTRVAITDLGEADLGRITEEVWAVMKGLRVSRARARIVANSKALHHLVPDLVPPIDRQYTFRFFLGRKTLGRDEEAVFGEMYRRFVRLAAAHRDTIERLVGQGWNTSRTKVLDNAVMGYVLTTLPPRAPGDTAAASSRPR